jgi:hypothetical protein
MIDGQVPALSAVHENTVEEEAKRAAVAAAEARQRERAVDAGSGAPAAKKPKIDKAKALARMMAKKQEGGQDHTGALHVSNSSTVLGGLAVAVAKGKPAQLIARKVSTLDLQSDGDALLAVSDLISKKDYINERVRIVDGKCVRDAVGSLVPNTKGGTVKYKFADLKYDVQRGLLFVGGDHRPRTNASKPGLLPKPRSHTTAVATAPPSVVPQEGRRSSRRSSKKVSYKEHEETKPNFIVQAMRPRDVFDTEWKQEGNHGGAVKRCALCQLPEGSSDKPDFLGVTWKWLKGSNSSLL